jgi:hypothetical protein
MLKQNRHTTLLISFHDSEILLNTLKSIEEGKEITGAYASHASRLKELVEERKHRNQQHQYYYVPSHVTDDNGNQIDLPPEREKKLQEYYSKLGELADLGIKLNIGADKMANKGRE